MARRRTAKHTGDPHREVIGWYEERLLGEAAGPKRFRWPAATIGPTWQRTPDGRWLLPEATLGWEVLGWCGVELQHGRGVPWRFTLEQARFVLWWFAVTESGSFVFRDAVLQRLKGWGKDPVGACLCAVEMAGPCRFAEWRGGQPVATDVPDAWVQTAAVSLEQTKNTMRLFPSLFTDEAKRKYRLQVGKEQVHGFGDQRLIQAVTSSPATLEGARATHVLLNETQHWREGNDGHEMAAVIERNATKSPDGAARTLRITNAPEPSEDSVARRDRDAWEQAQAGQSLMTGLLYDSLEAPADAPLTAEAAPEVIDAVRGDSVWLDKDRIVQAILDPRNPPSRSRRFWYNQVVAAEDAWVTPQHVDAATGDPLPDVDAADELVVFFDGSKSDDATGLMGCRLSDGYLMTLGVWQRPPGERGLGWLAPRGEVDARVDEVFESHAVVAFFADPSHAKDDEDGSGYWDGVVDGWHRRFSSQLRVWSVQAGHARHSVMWDMTSSERQRQFTEAAMRFTTELEDGDVVHDGHPLLRQHLKNARRYPNRWGVSLAKEHRESARKVDLAVCAVGARMLRRLVLNAVTTEKPAARPGRVVGFR